MDYMDTFPVFIQSSIDIFRRRSASPINKEVGYNKSGRIQAKALCVDTESLSDTNTTRLIPFIPVIFDKYALRMLYHSQKVEMSDDKTILRA